MTRTIHPHAPISRILIASLAVSLIAAAGAIANDKAETKKLVPNQELIVDVSDLESLQNPDADFTRENLLQDAFYAAAEDRDWLGDFKFRYNYNNPDDRGGRLEINIVDWERSVANMYECTISVDYHDADGKTISLGSFHATEPGITVTTGRDVSERFRDAAESAFDQALEKLAEETGID